LNDYVEFGHSPLNVIMLKDLGVYYDSLLLFDKHSSEKVNKA